MELLALMFIYEEADEAMRENIRDLVASLYETNCPVSESGEEQVAVFPLEVSQMPRVN